MKRKIDIKKCGWVLFAILVAVGLILWRSYFIDDYPICDWNICRWIAGISIILIFIIGAVCGRKR